MAVFDPYHKWLAIPPHEQPPHHYRLLGVVPFEDDADVVDTAAEQRMAYLRTCATGEFVALSQRLLNEVATARLCLLNPQKKAAYDAELRRRLATAPAKTQVPSGAPASRTTAKSSPAPVAQSVADPLDEFDDIDDLDAFEEAVRRPQRRASSGPKAGRRRKGDGWRPTPTVLALGIGGLVGLVLMLVVAIAYVAGRGTARPDGASPDEPGALVEIDVRPDRPGPTNSTAPRAFRTRPDPGSQTTTPPRGTDPPRPPSQTSPISTTGPAPRPAVAPFDAAQARTHQLAWAQHLGETVVVANSIGMQLVLIPPGEFLAGPEPVGKRVVLTRPFRIGRHEVTHSQWRTVMRSEPWGPGTARGTGTDLPVSHITWNDAVAFCQALTDSERAAGRLPADLAYRLPTEAEWEYACRAGTTSSFSFGEDPSLMVDHAWYKRNTSDAGSSQPNAVGLKLPNPWGLHDMYGNVREWCSDFADVQRPSGTDPTGPATGSYRVCRGGSWRTVDPAFLNSHDRTAVPPGLAASENGFRVVLSIVANPATGTVPPGVSAVPTPPPVAPPSRVGPAPPRAVAPFDAAQAKAHQEAWAKHLGEPVEVTNSIGMKFVVIPPGTFRMGSPPTQVPRLANEDQVEVVLARPFRLGIHEVTQAQWKAVVGTELWRGRPDVREGDDHAASCIGWDAAVYFCRRLTERERNAGRLPSDATYRLPTEAEWEWSCRAGSATRFWFGDDDGRLPEFDWIGLNASNVGERFAHPVGRKPGNPRGLHDLYGNVFEWCSDWFASDAPLIGGTDPAGPPAAVMRARRGGCWTSDSNTARSAFRSGNSPGFANFSIGFRVVLARTAPAPPASLPTPAASAPPRAVAPFDAAQAKAHQEAWAKHLGEPVETVNSLGMKFVLIPPGQFTLGSPSDERGRHAESEAPFHITMPAPMRVGLHEVTRKQWRDVVGSVPVSGPPAAGDAADDLPVTGITWSEAVVFCSRLTDTERAAGRLSSKSSYRLPSGSEWEIACRAGTTTAYSFGSDESRLPEHAWFASNTVEDGTRAPRPVGRKRPNDWGLFDMHGNVAEWCLDRGDRRIAGPPNGTSCVVRGGGFLGTGSSLRSAAYVLQPMNGPRIDLGLRVLLTIDPSSTGGAPPNVSAPPPAPTPVAPPARVGPAPPQAVAPFDAAQAKAHQEAWAKHLGEPVETVNSIGMKLVVIPPGTFRMGSPPDEPGRHPSNEEQGEVRLTRPFRMGIHEVTRRQWQAVAMPFPGGDSALVEPDGPIGSISWDDAATFAQRLTEKERSNGRLGPAAEYRLPTEAEWEWACRAGTTTAYSFGSDPSQMREYAWFAWGPAGASGYYAHAVGLKRPNAWGLFDMHGNAAEWCRDYGGGTLGGTDPLGPQVALWRISRGGGARSLNIQCRSAARNWQPPQIRDGALGLRVVLAAVVGSGTAPPSVSTTPKPPTRVGPAPPPAAAPFDATQAKAHQEAWAKHLGEPVETVNSLGMRFAIVPPGKFEMGQPGFDTVSVDLSRPFRIGIHEVTRSQWQRVVGTEPWSGKSVHADPTAPANYVDWFGAVEFCRRLTAQEREARRLSEREEYRLPTEAEWEWAARAGSTTDYWFGAGGAEVLRNGWLSENTVGVGRAYPHPVGTKGFNPWGLCDVYGNVEEFCSTISGRRVGGTDPTGPPAGDRRIARGGHFRQSARGVGIVSRAGPEPQEARDTFGFRVVRTIALP